MAPPNYGSASPSTSSATKAETMDFQPSPSSTERPSTENLDDSNIKETEQRRLIQHQESSYEIQLQSFQRTEKGETYTEPTKNQIRNLTCWLASLLFLVAGLVWLTVVARSHSTSASPSSSSNDAHADVPSTRVPLSTLHPVKDLGLFDFQRPESSRPSSGLMSSTGGSDNSQKSIPTNSWYQSFLMLDDEPTDLHRAYTIPYVIDAVGPIAGLRAHPNHILASSTVVQLNVVEQYGLTIGASIDATQQVDDEPTRRYKVGKMSNLGVTLHWTHFPMSSPIVRGMPYTTMRYEKIEKTNKAGHMLYPTIASDIPPKGDLKVDGDGMLSCGTSTKPIKVEREIEILFEQSDFSWLVFVSEPAFVQCVTDDNGKMQLQVVGRAKSQSDGHDISRPFYIRAAIYQVCTTGRDPIYCHQKQMHPTALHIGQGEYGDLLRKNGHLFPGEDTSFDYEVGPSKEVAVMKFNWDCQDMTNGTYQWNGNGTEPDLMVFALPHHWDMMHDVVNSPGDSIYCAHSIIGPACLVAGGNWALVEALPNITLRANRRPAPWSIELLANSLEKDILYTLPHFFQRGAGDTYFSGKMLAKLGRILLINEELSEMCKSIASNKQKLTFDVAYTLEQYSDACEGASFPTEDVTSNAISSLRSSVEIWINGTAETPFVFDSSWGGVVSCGCLFDGKVCKNEFPDCPSFSDPGLNFGNAFYNDMHFHYGYHIYAAAVVAHFDSEWGSEFFERVLLLVRSIANPTDDDGAFPKCRHKDWYQGHSWASGIVNPPFRNGRNQESSSEAIAAYESVALFGTVMANIFRTNSSTEQLRSALEVENIGRLLTATEIRSTNRYWHVSLDDKVKIFPSEFTARVVGILWQAMAQFQTWFGSKPFLVYGIQLLPLTPISDYRDSIKWMKSIYYPLTQSCDSDSDCEKSGWSILELAVLATVGHQNLATERALKVPLTVFESAGGNGHSLTNTLWFIATREQLTEPLPLKEGQTAPDTENDNLPVEFDLVDCYKPESCTEYVLDTIVDSYTCRQRIQWLMNNLGKSQKDACVQVASLEYYDVCGKCNPYAETKPKEDSGSESSICPPCSLEECSSDLNRCPTYEHTYVCSAGMNRGGCLSYNWDLESGECNACCELTNCLSVKPVVLEMKDKVNEKSDDSCPPCSAEVCRNSKIQCPSDFSAPYVCSEGESFGGCSPRPWSLENKQCKKCCKLFPACDE